MTFEWERWERLSLRQTRVNRAQLKCQRVIPVIV